jgi:hypothetical protein
MGGESRGEGRPAAASGGGGRGAPAPAEGGDSQFDDDIPF